MSWNEILQWTAIVVAIIVALLGSKPDTTDYQPYGRTNYLHEQALKLQLLWETTFPYQYTVIEKREGPPLCIKGYVVKRSRPKESNAYSSLVNTREEAEWMKDHPDQIRWNIRHNELGPC